MSMKKQFGVFRYWRHFAAYTYLLICLMDFVLMPIYYEWTNSKIKIEQEIAFSTSFKDGPSQIEAMRMLREERSWHPITLDTSGLVHLSFGAILGVSAYSKRRELVVEREEEEDLVV